MINRRNLLLAGVSASGAYLSRAPAARSQSLEKVSIRFNWTWVGNYTPVVLGRERGYYKDVGIDLSVGQGKGSGATVRQAGTKADTFVWADTSALILAAAQGVPIKSVMILAKSTLGVAWIDGRIQVKSARDLIGKKVSATPGDGNSQLWPAVLAANGMASKDVELVYLDGSAALGALRSGRVDAAFVGVTDQPVTLRNAGVPVGTMTYAEMGVPTLGSGIITHVDTIKQRPDLVRNMIAATQRSWAAALQDPKTAVEAVMKISETPLNENILLNGLKIFQTLATNTKPIGYIDPTAMDKTVDLLKKYGGVKTDEPATAFYTDEGFKIA